MTFSSIFTTDSITIVQGLIVTGVALVLGLISSLVYRFKSYCSKSFAVTLTIIPAIVAMLMISPFILPGCTCLGYLQGPRLWARTEDAMKQGRRRAKARARVGKKMVPRQQKPEI